MSKEPEHPQKGYREAYKRAEEMEHNGWYGSPARRPQSKRYKDNFARIVWKKEEKDHDLLGLSGSI